MLTDWLICFAMVLSGQAVITYAAVRMLRIEKVWLLWAVTVLFCAVTAYANSFTASSGLQAVWSPLSLVLSIALYVWLSGLRPRYAALAVACIMLATLLAELATVLATLQIFGVNVTSGPGFAYERPGAFLFLAVFHALLLGAALYAFAVLLKRVMLGSREKSSAGALLFPLSQCALLLAVMLAVRVIAPKSEAALLVGSAVTLAVLGAYLLFFAVRRRQYEQEIADSQIAAARARSALLLEHVRELEAQAERAAKLRHDFRNQVQVVELLCAQGERDGAAENLGELLAATRREAGL
ncbi:MAG: hypothetical protein ACI36W_02420 [Coriobacteriales bacterium]